MVGTVFTGSVLKYFDYKLNRMKHNFDKEVQIRSFFDDDLQTLKTELELRREEIKMLEDHLDEWKHKYYQLLETLLSLKSELNKE